MELNSSPICENYFNAIATPTVIKQPPNGSISGCLYSRYGEIISISQRFGGYHGDFYPSIDPKTIDNTDFSLLPVIKGRCLYLGHLMPHYGHFLLEMLSSFWTFNTFQEYDFFLFHPFVFGEEFPSYIKEAFNAFQIPLCKVKLLKSKIVIEEVTIPERLVKLNKSANNEISKVYLFLADFCASNFPSLNIYSTNRFYFSRVRISLSAGERAVLNEPFIERALNRLGFVTVYPELLSFPEQINLIQNAKIICGLSGSALHNCVFMKPGTILIEIGDARSLNEVHPMQQICNKITNAITYFISFDGIILNSKLLISIINKRKIILKIKQILDMNKLTEVTINGNWVADKQNKSFATNFLMIYKNLLRLLKYRLIMRKK